MSVYFKSAMSADDTLAARSHARISASPASRAATQNLTDFTGTLYPPIGGPSTILVSMVEVRVGSKPGLPPWGPHVRFRRVQTLVREGSPLGQAAQFCLA